MIYVDRSYSSDAGRGKAQSDGDEGDGLHGGEVELVMILKTRDSGLT